MAGYKLQKDYKIINIEILKGSTIKVDEVKLQQLRDGGFINQPKASSEDSEEK